MLEDVNGWPTVPQDERPRPIPHNGITPEAFIVLTEAGWAPYDIRLMSSDSMEDRAKAVLAFLEGVRLGSVEPDKNSMRFIELEARICGIWTGKKAPARKTRLSDHDLDTLLDFGAKIDDTESE